LENWNIGKKEYFQTSTDARLVTARGKSPGHTQVIWQMVGREIRDGFLYGVGEGWLGTGNITFIYPDFSTGLQGYFEDGTLVQAREVRIIGERCYQGVKELLTRSKNVNQRKVFGEGCGAPG